MPNIPTRAWRIHQIVHWYFFSGLIEDKPQKFQSKAFALIERLSQTDLGWAVLCKAFFTGNVSAIEFVFYAIGERYATGRPEVAGMLTWGVIHSDEQVRWAAIGAAGDFASGRDPLPVSALLWCMCHERSAKLRQFATRSMMKLRRQTIAAFVDGLDANPVMYGQTQIVCMRWLASTGSADSSEVWALLESPCPFSRRFAVVAAGIFESPIAREELLHQASNSSDPDVALPALEQIYRIARREKWKRSDRVRLDEKI